MADIRKRTGKNGTTYQVRYPSTATKSGYGFKTFDTLKEARAFVESGKAHQIGNRPAYDITTVPDAVRKWLDVCEKVGRDGREKVEPMTLDDYRRRARVIRSYQWPKSLQDLEPSDIVHFRDWLLENKSRDLARKALSALHSVIIEMKHQGQIKNDPAAGISIKSGGRYEDAARNIAIPTDKEMREILAAADRLANKNRQLEQVWARYRPWIYLAAFSGMRPSEIRGLPWSSVGTGYVEVTQRADKTGRIGPVKSKAGRRKIYLPEFVTDMVMAWRAKCPPSPEDLVFPTASGRPQLLGRIRSGAWVPALKEAQLLDVVQQDGRATQKPRYTMYSLRHYYASKLIEMGTDLKYIQETMGHSSIEITFNVYGHLIQDKEDEKRATVERLATNVLEKSCGESVASAL